MCLMAARAATGKRKVLVATEAHHGATPWCTLVRAEKTRDYCVALHYNLDFHFGIYRRCGMPQLTEMLDRIWTQVGPMLNFLNPHGHPRFDGALQHTSVLRGLQQRDVKAVRKTITDDLIEGGRNFVRVLEEIEADPLRAEALLALRNASLQAEAAAWVRGQTVTFKKMAWASCGSHAPHRMAAALQAGLAGCRVAPGGAKWRTPCAAR